MNSKTLIYVGIAIVVYVVWSNYQTQQKALVASAAATAAGNSTGGIISGIGSAAGNILGDFDFGGDDDY